MNSIGPMPVDIGPMNKLVFLFAFSAFSTTVSALDLLGDKTGVGGFVNLGFMGGEVSNNFLANMKTIDVELSDDTINDLGSPSAKGLISPIAAFELSYTFSNKKTRITAGNDFANYLQFDRTTILSLRHDFEGIGTLQISYETNPAIGTEVWTDPYLTGAPRTETDLEMSGIGLTWDRIFGSNFELKLRAIELDIDDENSGASQSLTDEERQLLDRNGDVYRVDLGYLYTTKNRKHIIRPSIRYTERDLDGRAMAIETIAVELFYVYLPAQGWRLVSKMRFGDFEGDEVNPLFGKRNDGQSYVVSSALFFRGFGWENWSPNITFIYGKNDADISFNRSEVWLITAAVLRRF